MPWIAWFCSLTGHHYFVEVAEEFIEDDFNLTGLNSIVPFYKEALEMILDLEPGNIKEDNNGDTIAIFGQTSAYPMFLSNLALFLSNDNQ